MRDVDAQRRRPIRRLPVEIELMDFIDRSVAHEGARRHKRWDALAQLIPRHVKMHEHRSLVQQRSRSLIQQGAAAQSDHYSAFSHKVMEAVGFTLPELRLLLLTDKIID